jgi:hypothetical protein
MEKQRSVLLAVTVWTWIVALAVAALFFFVLRGDLAGNEWLGSPLLGMALLIVLTTTFYFVARNRPLQPTLIAVIWVFFLFLSTTANMLTLAHFIFGRWLDFQVMPITGALALILIAAGVHFSLKKEWRSPLFGLFTWTLVLFLLTVSTVAMFAYVHVRSFGHLMTWQDWLPYPLLGTGLWAGLMAVAVLIWRARPVSWLDALLCWAWPMAIGTGVSMAAIFVILDQTGSEWPAYPIIGTWGFALLVTALKLSLQDHRGERALPVRR